MTRKHLETCRAVKARARRHGKRLRRKTLTWHLRLARRRWRRRKTCTPPPPPK